VGSGGGRSSVGITTKKSRPSKQPGRGGGAGGGGDSSGGEDCDISFETDLASVDPAVAPGISVGDDLQVTLIKQGNFDVAVCRTEDGRVAGSLANIEDLARLVSCIRAGASYVAIVRNSGDTFCTVYVERQS